MNEVHLNPEDRGLSALLRVSRTTPPLPPRFQESVWRRIEGADREVSVDGSAWLEVILQRLLRPRLALATVAVLMLFGAVLGIREGVDSARQADQARYLEVVAHSVLR